MLGTIQRAAPLLLSMILLSGHNALAEVPLSVPAQRVVAQQNKLTVNLGAQGPAAGEVQVLSRENAGAKLIPLVQAVTASPRAGPQLVIPADRQVIVKRKAEQPSTPKPLPTTPTEVQGGILLDSVSVPGAGGQRDVRAWSLVVHAVQSPLPWDAQHKAYSTKLAIGLESSAATPGHLESPVVIDLSANGATVDPPRLQVQESGVGGFAYAVVSLPNHESTGVVRALSDFGEQAYSVTSAPQANSLELEPSLTNIVGFGIGTSTIAVVLRAEDGMEFRPLQVGSISLTTTGGRLGQADLSFPPNSARASTMIRSAFLGTANIGAKIDNLAAPAVTVTFTTPWSILVAIVLGAVLGAFVRARSNQQGLTSSQVAAGAGAGVILAMGSFVGLTMVVSLPDTALVTEAGCFVIGALEAYLGRTALDRLVPSASTA